MKTNRARAGTLPQAGNTRFHFENPPAVPNVVGFKFIGYWRARTNKRHITAQNVPELGKFIEARFAKESPDRCGSRIVREVVDDSPSKGCTFTSRLTTVYFLD